GRVLVAGALGAFSLPRLCFAQPIAIDRTPPGSPPIASVAMTYDSGRSRVVLFTAEEMWELGSGLWVRRSLAASPTGLEGSPLAYDSAHGVSVLVGGVDTTGSLLHLWTWDGSSWVQAPPGAAPKKRVQHGLAYDSARDRIVLFGGHDVGSTYYRDTWEWDGAVWHLRSPAVQPPRHDWCVVAYDSARARTVARLLDHDTRQLGTWEWDGGNWSERAPGALPQDIDARIAYDAARGRSVLSLYFGGFREWDGNQWAKSPSPDDDTFFARGLAYDAGGGRTIAFGSGVTNSTWGWDGASWTPIFPVA